MATRLRRSSTHGSNQSPFERHMQEYLDTLLSDFEQDLSKTQQTLETALDDLTGRLGEKCQVLEEADLVARQKLGDECLEIGSKAGRRVFSINELVEEYDGAIRQRSMVLDELWSEWAAIQRELLCLSVEVFGSDVVSKDMNQPVPSELRHSIDDAHVKFESTQKQGDALTGQLDDIRMKADQASAEAVRKLDEQLQGIRAGQKRKREALQRALDAFNED